MQCQNELPYERENKENDRETSIKNNSLERYGVRALKTRNAITKTAEHLLTSVRHLLIKECMEVAPNYGNEIRTLTKSFKNQALTEIEKEMDLLFVEENLLENFNQLDTLELKQKNKTSSWRPTGNPDNDVAVHQMKVLMEHEDNLKDLLKKESEKLETLKKEVLKLRKTVESTSKLFSECRSERTQNLNLLQKTSI